MRHLAGSKPNGVRLVGTVCLQHGKRRWPPRQKHLDQMTRIAVIEIEFGRQPFEDLIPFGLRPVDADLLVQRHKLRLA